jgi:PASTA domain-containing protein
MSDEQEQRRAREGREPRPDETREFDPFSDDPGPTAANQPDDGPLPGDAWVGDRTEQMPGVPAGDDATVVTPRSPQPNETSVLPPARDWAAQDAAWAGRAEVRPPRPGQSDYGTGSDWDAAPPVEPRGRWWMPILVGVIALILLGLLGWGIYLITQDTDDEETPAPAASVSAPAATTKATTPPTTEPTTTPPTTEPTVSTNPAEITVPALVGLSRADAQEALQRRGLRFRVISQPSDATPGNVIDSDPKEGQQVPADTQVTLVIAAQRTTTPTTVPTATGPGEPVDED